MTDTYPIRPEAAAAPTSGIVDTVNYGRTREGLIPLWVGEGDLATPAFIAEAATRALAAGETFYTYQRGIPELRAAIAKRQSALLGKDLSPERFFVTTGGMHAVQIAMRLVAGTGDEVIVPTPAWPNFRGALTASGAGIVEVAMTPSDTGFALDLARLEAAIGPRTKAIVINSPANPTGWTATREELAAILEIARARDLWIVSDEIYQRFVWEERVAVGGRAASFHDVMREGDRVLFVQTLSKNYAMTGWRVGWLEASPELGQTIENLVQYSSSGSPVFVQRAAIAALEHGEGFVAHQIARARRGREIVSQALAPLNAVRFAPPPGAFYAFFGVPGADSRALARRLVDEANVGLAPGSAFGSGGEDGMRLCFARKDEDLVAAMGRLVPVLRG
ncbi:pyridoxal phosphate-dependent aminotransferase [Salinarimonas ramus]|uniref:aspartate transaminase n=1 Tax=Salinarimonas ramus TaxID=690164 RepID=A0A917Q7F8_9HYPH|nr:pyridoxal phosphate-dependent aminotransferase [Salinarimonas ramus]GGK27150.1 aminotransferase [Salinarimonas ramus]